MNINEYSDKFSIPKVTHCEEGDMKWDSYTFKEPDLTIWTEEDLITDILSYTSLIYNNAQLFKYSCSELLSLFKSQGAPSDPVDHIWLKYKKKPRSVYVIEEFNIQIWAFGEKIEQFIVSEEFIDSEE